MVELLSENTKTRFGQMSLTVGSTDTKTGIGHMNRVILRKKKVVILDIK